MDIVINVNIFFQSEFNLAALIFGSPGGTHVQLNVYYNIKYTQVQRVFKCILVRQMRSNMKVFALAVTFMYNQSTLYKSNLILQGCSQIRRHQAYISVLGQHINFLLGNKPINLARAARHLVTVNLAGVAIFLNGFDIEP